MSAGAADVVVAGTTAASAGAADAVGVEATT
jgi:hypothetical protein